jgi:hypothetical protein
LPWPSCLQNLSHYRNHNVVALNVMWKLPLTMFCLSVSTYRWNSVCDITFWLCTDIMRWDLCYPYNIMGAVSKMLRIWSTL